MRIVGRLKQDRWADKEGHNHSRVKVVGENVEFKTKFDKKPSEVPESPQDEPDDPTF